MDRNSKADDERQAARAKPAHLGKLACGHVVRFVLSPITGWGEWCPRCQDFYTVLDGV
jgi:hypothetical protein